MQAISMPNLAPITIYIAKAYLNDLFHIGPHPRKHYDARWFRAFSWQAPETRPSRNGFHGHCRILLSQQVKTLISIALRRADLTTALSIFESTALLNPLTAGLIAKIPWKPSID
jgi:hypothetical protein